MFYFWVNQKVLIAGPHGNPFLNSQEVSGMGFHITQPGSSVATSLIEGEAKPKHVLLLEIKVVLVKEPACHFFFFIFSINGHTLAVVVLSGCREANIVQPKFL